MTRTPVQFDTPGGRVTAILCGRGQRRPKCEDCGHPASILCDYPVKRNGRPGSCDRKCCAPHSVPVGDELDYCLVHARHERLFA